MKVAVSRCLLGENCKYSGGNNYDEALCGWLRGHEVIPVCPEVSGGLPIPREPCEIVAGTVQTAGGISCDAQYCRCTARRPTGAQSELRLPAYL